MVFICEAAECFSHSDKLRNLTKYPWMANIRWVKWPRNDALALERWKRLVRRGPLRRGVSAERGVIKDELKVSRRSRLCSRHFDPDQYNMWGDPKGDPKYFAWNNWGKPTEPRSQSALNEFENINSHPVQFENGKSLPIKSKKIRARKQLQQQVSTFTNLKTPVYNGENESIYCTIRLATEDEGEASESGVDMKEELVVVKDEPLDVKDEPLDVNDETQDFFSDFPVGMSLFSLSTNGLLQQLTDSKRRKVNQHLAYSDSSQQTDISIGNQTKDVSSQCTHVIVCTAEVSQQTNVSGSQVASLMSSLQENLFENNALESRLNEMDVPVCKPSFLSTDKKTEFYTGIDKLSIMCVLHSHIKKYRCFSTNIHRMSYYPLLICLMKLKLNLSFEHIGKFLHTSTSSASSRFSIILCLLETRIVPALIVWPEREQLQKCTPELSQQLSPRCIYIIEILEVPIDCSSKTQIKKLTYSATRSGHTMKYLLVVTPQGAVSFISKAWVGGSADLHILENSGFLDLIEPGDVILASKQFSLGENIELFNKTLKIPTFTKRGGKLCKVDPKVTKILSGVHICLNRVLGAAPHRYNILKESIITNWIEPNKDGKSPLDKIVRLTCALANLSTYSSPFEVKMPLKRKDTEVEECVDITDAQ